MPLSLDLLSRQLASVLSFGEPLDVLQPYELESNFASLKNCYESLKCCEGTLINRSTVVLTRCGEGPDPFLADLIYAHNPMSEYSMPLTVLVGVGLVAVPLTVRTVARLSSWLGSNHWVPPTMGGAFPRPAEDANAYLDDSISPEEIRANRQCDDARRLTHEAWAGTPEADLDIARALIVHLANWPTSNDTQRDRVIELCLLLSHALKFALHESQARLFRLDQFPNSLIRHDEVFQMLHRVLAPAWETDTEGAPTFSVHPVDVQLFDPDETTDDLAMPRETKDDDPEGLDAIFGASAAKEKSLEQRQKEMRERRERLTDKAALARVRTRVTTSIAASVREDCASEENWRERFKIQLIGAAWRPSTCGQIVDSVGNCARYNISPRDMWIYPNDPPEEPFGPEPVSMPPNVAQWLVRVLIVAGDPRFATLLSPELAALARMDTPATLVVHTPGWKDLVKGVEVMGERHWRASFATVCLAGQTGQMPEAFASASDDAPKPDNPKPDNPPGHWHKKPARSSKSRHSRAKTNWRHN